MQQPCKQQNTGGWNGESSGWNPHGSGLNPCCSPFYPNAGPTRTSYHLTELHLTLQGSPHSNWSEPAPNTAHHAIYLWSKLVCLFCLYRWDPPNQDASDRVLGLFGKLSTRRGAWAWFHGVWTSVGWFPGSSGNHLFQFASFSRWWFRLGSGSLFFSKMGLNSGFIFSIRGVSSGVSSFFIFQVRLILIFSSITFGFCSNIQILEWTMQKY